MSRKNESPQKIAMREMMKDNDISIKNGTDVNSVMRDMDILDSAISRITDKVLPIVKEWQERPLEEVYAVVLMPSITMSAVKGVFSNGLYIC